MRLRILPNPFRLLSVPAGVSAVQWAGFALAAAIAFQVHGTPQLDPLPEAPPEGARVTRELLPPRDPVADRDAILELVRRHRSAATDDWKQVLADAIYAEATAAEVDPLMVASIVARESSFKSRAVSGAGAVGLMQLRPWVAKDVAQGADVAWRGLETLHDPELNLRLGILYYKQLVDRFDGDPYKALTAYNYGPTRVSRSVRQGTYQGSDYANRILSLYDELSAR